MFFRLKSFITLISIVLTAAASVAAQDSAARPAGGDAGKGMTAEQIAESVVLIYGFPGGRETLNQIRKTTFERGKLTVTNADGSVDKADYERWVLRGENLDKERIRFDKQFANAKFALVYSNEKIFGLFNDTVFTPREDAARDFENHIWHGLEALLRYKENESKIELAGRDKVMAVDFYLLDVTDKQGRKTRFYISVKSLRVMMLEYTANGIEYKRKFYDYNYAQGTLVPYRTVLWANGKQVEETEIQTITFGQRVEEDLFQAS